ncbi:MAG: ketoacyl-ACP synthase III, partial [Ignavibacteria bacterium]|nr:ketoacyl-ACP synthase III [Ignavibacteria bacterium]
MAKEKLFEIKKRNAVIKGIGSYAPERVLTNQFFNELLGEDVDTWLQENLTIKERRWCNQNQSTADLCIEAAKVALQNANISAEDLDLIIVATDTPEYISPSTSSVVQYRLGAKKAGTFDINTACAGFVTALNVGSKFIMADEHYKNVLVIGAYAMSKYLDLQDKKTVTLFADGAGAVVLSAEEFTNRG